MSELVGNVLVGQSGGPTSVINASVAGIVAEALNHECIEEIYGTLNGVLGLLQEDLVDLASESQQQIRALRHTPGAALGTCRYKLKKQADFDRVLEVFKAHNIRYFFYIGGNDSADTVRIVSEQAHSSGYPIRCLHIPKTIDNDLVGNDHTPGFPSAARFVVQAFIGANLDNASLPGIYVGVVMGRHAGFLTAASALARKFPGDGPHLIYLPERTFDPERFVAQVKDAQDRHGRCVVAVSEGVHDADGAPILAKLAPGAERDPHGNVQLSGTGALADLLCALIRDRLGIKRIRGDTFGYLQRSFAGCVSDVDQREAREVGEAAFQFARTHERDGSVRIKRVGDYAVDYELGPLEAVAAKTRVMEDGLISPAGTDVTEAFDAYLRPLLGSDLPQAHRLRAKPVPKRLRAG